jgi:hypothetical protein
MGRYMHLAIGVTMGAFLVLSVTEAFAQSGKCRNRDSDPENPICWDNYLPTGGRCGPSQCEKQTQDCNLNCSQTCARNNQGAACDAECITTCKAKPCEDTCPKWTNPGVNGQPDQKCDDKSAWDRLQQCLYQTCCDPVIKEGIDCQVNCGTNTQLCNCRENCKSQSRRGAC